LMTVRLPFGMRSKEKIAESKIAGQRANETTTRHL
jgi:hypothetical protein